MLGTTREGMVSSAVKRVLLDTTTKATGGQAATNAKLEDLLLQLKPPRATSALQDTTPPPQPWHNAKHALVDTTRHTRPGARVHSAKVGSTPAPLQ